MAITQDLDGEVAFDKVLDRLTEALQKNARDEGAVLEARAHATVAVEARAAADRRVKALEAKAAAGLPKLAELHSAAQAALSAVGTNMNTPLYERLQNAIKEAGQYCDEIPF